MLQIFSTKTPGISTLYLEGYFRHKYVQQAQEKYPTHGEREGLLPKKQFKKNQFSGYFISHTTHFVEMFRHNIIIYPLFKSVGQFKAQLSNKNGRIKH